jgi:hypothetical protein
MRCPKCGLEQESAPECSRCGIIIEKFRPSPGEVGYPAGMPESAGGFPGRTWETGAGTLGRTPKSALAFSAALTWNLLLTLLLVAGMALLAVSFLRKDAWPARGEILESVLEEPVQTPTDTAPFEVETGGIVYTITPRFSYELSGLVVSSHDCGAWWDIYHRDQWRDFLNLKDLCVVWGQNLRTEVYRDMKFSNDSWTCFCSWPDAAVGARFAPACLSNNHLLCRDRSLKDLILKTSRGDQIHFKGYLAEYGHGNRAFWRGTSTSRTDTGNGACETVYVEDYRILRQANAGWRLGFRVSKVLILAAAVLFVIRLFRSPVSFRGE